MPNIGLIDDRIDQRESIARRIRRYLKTDYSDWEVVETDPLAKLDDYPGWLIENDITVLLTDQRLTEIPLNETGEAASYEGHQLIAAIRTYNSRLPIYVVTAFKPTEVGLVEQRKNYEYAFDRDSFAKNTNDFVVLMIRSGEQFIIQHQAELIELSSISAKIPNGEATASEIERGELLQTSIDQEFGLSTLSLKSEFIEEYEAQLEQLSSAISDLQEKLSREK